MGLLQVTVLILLNAHHILWHGVGGGGGGGGGGVEGGGRVRGGGTRFISI